MLVDLKDLSGVPRDQQFGIAAGIVASFITGLLALRMLTFIAGRGRLPWFAAWLIPLGIVTLACF